MTAKKDPLFARQLFGDAHSALIQLQDAVDNPKANWRVPWVAAVAILRGIGHVLKEVDGANDSEVADFMEKAWSSWKTDPLFQQLKTSRDKTLKVYDFGVTHHVSPVWSSRYQRPEDDPDARNCGFLFFEGSAKDAVRTLWNIWIWWSEKLAQLEMLTGRIELDAAKRQMTFDRFVSSCDSNAI